MTNLGFVYDTSFQDVKGFKATGSVLALSDVRSTFFDLLNLCYKSEKVDRFIHFQKATVTNRRK